MFAVIYHLQDLIHCSKLSTVDFSLTGSVCLVNLTENVMVLICILIGKFFNLT